MATNLRSAFSRQRTLLWAAVALAGFCTRQDLEGVTSFIRSQQLKAKCYGRLLDLFHTSSVRLTDLTQLWARIALRIFADSLVRENGRIVLLADGIKSAKEGKKMPGVKSLHQEPTNNSKPEYIMGHSCQCISVLVQAPASYFSVHLALRIHEGVKFTNRDKRTLINKLVELLHDVTSDFPTFYIVADAFYACGALSSEMLQAGHHLISRVRSNAVTFMQHPSVTNRKRGRPRVYGGKLRLRSVFDNRQDLFEEVSSPVYGDHDVKIRIYSLDLVWRPLGKAIRFVWVQYPW